MSRRRNDRTIWSSVSRVGTSVAALIICAAGCTQEMADQPRYEPLEASLFFADGRTSRPLVPGTVPRGHLQIDSHFDEGLVEGEPADTLPPDLLGERDPLDLLRRGRERYTIFCSPCHDLVGTGNGMVVRRGFPPPPSLHTPRLRDASVGYIFRVATHGTSRMPDYERQVPASDRWAIAAYVKALQLSQHAPATYLSETERAELQNEAGRTQARQEGTP